ncbi:MAG: holo-ACP synthase, partial [Clostridia bacterium]|nr:holo-ACP synthase [Clostridia bacterium]
QKRVFTKQELLLCCDKADFYAALAVRFAAKEAVLKAFGTGLRGCSWRDIEILSDPGGRPKVVLSGAAQKTAEQMGIMKISISLSHSKENALAFCVAEGGEEYNVAGNSGGNACIGSDSN